MTKQNSTKAKPKQAQKESFIDSRNRQYAARGNKPGPIQMIGSALGGVAGGIFGGPMGMGIGATLGGAVGNGIGYLTGTGDYVLNNFRSIKSNACTVPSFKRSESTVITHREYLTDIVSGAGTPSAFTANTYPLNPGATLTFPWLAQIAANYEEYEIQGMVFEFISTSGESVASSNTALGTVIMATEYDPTKPIFSSKQAMENYTMAVSFKPSTTMMHAVECKKALTPVKQLYVRTGAPVSGTDLRWTDFGNFTIATVGMQASGTFLGELFVTYKIKLLKPRLPVTLGLGGQIASAHYYRTGVTSAIPLGTTTTFSSGPTVVTFTGTTATWFAEPTSKWAVIVSCIAATSTTAYTATYTGAVGNPILQGDAASGNVAAGGNITVLQQYLTSTNAVGGANIQLTIPLPTIVGAATVDFTLIQLDTTVTN
jgi:hypothetical protein